MLLRRLLSILAFFAIVATATAQDTHYTLHNMAPLWMNPAQAGAFSGSIRVSGIYRGQWHGFGGIKAPSLSVDAPVIRGLRKQDWIGAGFLLIYDKAGSDNSIVKTSTGFGASYHLALDKKQQNVLTLGVQYGSVSFGLNPDRDNCQQQTCFDPLIGGGGNNQPETFGGMGGGGGGGNNQNGPRDNYTDINAGLMYRTVLNKKDKNTLEVGLAWQHITTDDYRSFTSNSNTMPNPMPMPGVDSIGSNSEESRERKGTIHGHATLDYKLSDKIRFMPTLFYQTSAQNSSLSIQAWAGYGIKEDLLFKFGLGYRTGDAGKILVGLEKDRLRVAASYDIPLSQLTPTLDLGSVNSFELAANYIFNIYKKPEVKPNLLCPQI